jgi:hypothetical protein
MLMPVEPSLDADPSRQSDICTSERLVEILKCSGCRRPFRHASTLPCGHSLCIDCLCAPPPPSPPSSSRGGILDQTLRVLGRSPERDAPKCPDDSCPDKLRNTVYAMQPRQDVVLAKILALLYKATPTMYDKRGTPDDTTKAADGDSAAKRLAEDERLTSDVLSELECQVCFNSLFEPVTTPCGHTFCRKCLARALDHAYVCPLCRSELPGFSYFHKQPENRCILSLLTSIFPDIYAERQSASEREESERKLETPIFVCTLAFPGLPMSLHIFEPRYRLMMRRAMEANRRFGMVLPASESDDGPHEYGTMLEIKSMRMLPDGRSLVETMGIYRFRILESGILDGYTVARIERVEDDVMEEAQDGQAETLEQQEQQQAADGSGAEAEEERRLPRRPPTSELIQACRDFVTTLLGGVTTSWMLQRLSSAYGPIPSDPTTFSYWVACVVPDIDDYERAKLLEVCVSHMCLLAIATLE